MLTSVTVVAALCGVVVGWGIRSLAQQRVAQQEAYQASTADRTPQELIQALESGYTSPELYRECLRVLKQAERTYKWESPSMQEYRRKLYREAQDHLRAKSGLLVDPEQEWRA